MLLGRDGSGAEMKAGSMPTGPMGWEGPAICQVFLKETTVEQLESCKGTLMSPHS